MTQLDSLNCKEAEAVKELRSRLKNVLKADMYDDVLLFYRFLRARDFDIDKAEAMLRKHIIWRKSFQVDTILETFQPNEFIVNYMRGSFIGFDKDGCILRYSPVGNIDIKDVIKCVKFNDYFRHCIWFAEKDIAILKKENERTGRNASQVTFIFDLDKLALANVTNKASTELFLRLTTLNQENYPERMKALYIINAPAYFTIVFSVVKRIMSSAMIRKIHVYGQTGWQEAFLKFMDPDVLPAFLGGNRTDPDGNPDCHTFVFRGGKVPPKYYLSKEERSFKDPARVERLTVPQLSKAEVEVEVERAGSLLEWEFEVSSKDVGFGLFLREPAAAELRELLPAQRFETPDGTEPGSYKCPCPGTYVFQFDNSYSWMSSKDVQYCFTVHKPETEP